MKYYLAVDIGASSGRHILAHLEDGKIVLEEMYRFTNGNVTRDGHLCWELDRLFEEIVNGIAACAKAGKAPSSMLTLFFLIRIIRFLEIQLHTVTAVQMIWTNS